MENKGKIVIINVDEPLDKLETAMVNHVRSTLDNLLISHSKLGVAMFSAVLLEMTKPILQLVIMEKEVGDGTKED